MNSVVKLVAKDVDNIPFQEASLDIWDKKYRLVSKAGEPVDKSMDDTDASRARSRTLSPSPSANTGTSVLRGRCGAGRSPRAA